METIQTTFGLEKLVAYAKTPYQVHFTNNRLLLFARTGLILKRESVVTIAYEDVIKLDYREKGIFKKGHAIVQTPLQKYEFEGDTQVIKALIQQLQKLVPTRKIESVKERETIIKEKETVLVQCNYCKTLMPQTSTYCPNCGARRMG